MNSGYFGKAGEYLNTWGQQSWLWLPISKPTLRTASIHKTWAVCRQTPCTFPICSSFCSTFCFTAAWKKNKIKLASPAFKQTLVCIQGDGKGLQSEIYKRTWILDKKNPNKSEKWISPNKPKVALKLKSFLTDPIYMKKNYARLTPSTPKFTSCCLQNSCRLPVIFLFRDGWLDIYLFLLKSPLLWKKKRHLCTCISIQKVSPKSSCQSKTNLDLNYNHVDLLIFSENPWKALFLCCIGMETSFEALQAFTEQICWPLATAAASSLLQHGLANSLWSCPAE